MFCFSPHTSSSSQSHTEMLKGHQRLGAVLFSALILLLSTVMPIQVQAQVTKQAGQVVDKDGRVFHVTQAYKRIISLYAAHTANLMELGLDKEIIATGRSDEARGKRPTLRFSDDPERLLALQPDLVLVRPMISRSYPQLVQRLQASGVAVVSLQPTSMDELFLYWETLGKLTGKAAEAKAMQTRFTDQLALFARRIESIPPEQRKKVYFEAIHRRMKTFAPSSIAMFVLAQAGGMNVAQDALRLRNTNIAEYGKEKILAKAGDIDVFLAQKGRMNPVTREEIINEPGFQVIKAVQNKKVFLIEERLVSRPTLGLLTAIEQIMTLLYPNLIPARNSSNEQPTLMGTKT